MASSRRFIWQGSHGRSSRSGIPSIIPSPPPALCDRVQRLPGEPCGFLVCGVWGCRVYVFCVSAAAGGPSKVTV